MLKMAEVELWLHPDIFYYGIVYAHPKLTTSYLKKVMTYARNKGKDGGYPNLSWSVWKHMAVNKMLMREDLAWMYFEMFNCLRQITAKERLEEAEFQHQLLESGDANLYKQQRQVPTLEFVLFLYMQQANKVSLRRSLLGEEWPGASPRSSMESPGHQSKLEAVANMHDERKHIQFVLSGFSQIVELLCEGYNAHSLSQADLTFSADAVKAMGYVIKGRIVKQSNIFSVFEIATRHRIQGKSGYSRSTGSFSLRLFESWLQANLIDNPYGLTSCLTSGVKLKWDSHTVSAESNRKKARIMTNVPLAPAGHKLVFFTQCSNQTIARQSSVLLGSYLKLHRCNKSYFYLLSPLRCVSIEKCTGTTIVLGPVATCVRLVNCQHVTLIAPCRSVTVTACSHVKLYVSTPMQPIILSDSTSNASDAEPSVVVAPYNTFYPDLENHLASVGLTISPQTDQWNNPICVANVHNLSHSHSRLSDVVQPRSPRSSGVGDTPVSNEEAKFYRTMAPLEFYTFSIPFKIKEDSNSGLTTTEIPGGLPPDYAQAVKSKQKATDKWRKAVLESKMTKDELHSFQQLVEEKFKLWVMEAGHQRQLDDLGASISG